MNNEDIQPNFAEMRANQQTVKILPGSYNPQSLLIRWQFHNYELSLLTSYPNSEFDSNEALTQKAYTVQLVEINGRKNRSFNQEVGCFVNWVQYNKPRYFIALELEGYYVGKGGSSTVFKAFELDDNFEIAQGNDWILKAMHLPDRYQEFINRTLELTNFFQTTSQLIHWQDDKYVVVSTDAGLNLTNLYKHRTLALSERLNMATQLFDQLILMHNNTPQSPPVIHNDIKFDNICYKQKANGELHLQLIDFDLAQSVKQNAKLAYKDDFTYNVAYLPPETIPDIYHQSLFCDKTDVYLAGLTVSNLLGKNLFHVKTNPARFVNEIKIDPKWNMHGYQFDLKTCMVSFLTSMLHPNPHQRPHIERCLKFFQLSLQYSLLTEQLIELGNRQRSYSLMQILYYNYLQQPLLKAQKQFAAQLLLLSQELWDVPYYDSHNQCWSYTANFPFDKRMDFCEWLLNQDYDRLTAYNIMSKINPHRLNGLSFTELYAKTILENQKPSLIHSIQLGWLQKVRLEEQQWQIIFKLVQSTPNPSTYTSYIMAVYNNELSERQLYTLNNALDYGFNQRECLQTLLYGCHEATIDCINKLIAYQLIYKSDDLIGFANTIREFDQARIQQTLNVIASSTQQTKLYALKLRIFVKLMLKYNFPSEPENASLYEAINNKLTSLNDECLNGFFVLLSIRLFLSWDQWQHICNLDDNVWLFLGFLHSNLGLLEPLMANVMNQFNKLIADQQLLDELFKYTVSLCKKNIQVELYHITLFLVQDGRTRTYQALINYWGDSYTQETDERIIALFKRNEFFSSAALVFGMPTAAPCIPIKECFNIFIEIHKGKEVDANLNCIAGALPQNIGTARYHLLNKIKIYLDNIYKKYPGNLKNSRISHSRLRDCFFSKKSPNLIELVAIKCLIDNIRQHQNQQTPDIVKKNIKQVDDDYFSLNATNAADHNAVRCLKEVLNHHQNYRYSKVGSVIYSELCDQHFRVFLGKDNNRSSKTADDIPKAQNAIDDDNDYQTRRHRSVSF